MRLSKDLVNKSVVSIDEGRIVGQVKDVYFSADLSRMVGIFLGKEGLIRRKSLIIPVDAVVVFGIDAVLVKTASALTDSKMLTEAEQWIRLNDLEGRDVDTPGGTRVGTIGDVILNEDGRVDAFYLSRVLVEGPIAALKQIDRRAMIDSGQADGVLTIDLPRAEDPDHYVPPVVEAAPKSTDSVSSETKPAVMVEETETFSTGEAAVLMEPKNLPAIPSESSADIIEAEIIEEDI
jgi:uncharacterized protein YrrD